MIRPLHDYVLVKVIPVTMSPGGLHIPESGQEDRSDFTGTVVAVGPGNRVDGAMTNKPDVEVGDTVVFGRRMGWTLNYRGEEYLAIHDTDLIAVVPAEDKPDMEITVGNN